MNQVHAIVVLQKIHPVVFCESANYCESCDIQTMSDECPKCGAILEIEKVKEMIDDLYDEKKIKIRRFKLLMKIQQNQKKSVKITCFLTRNSVYLRSER